MRKKSGKKKRRAFLNFISVFILTFALAIAISSFSQYLMSQITVLYISFLLLFTIILLGIIFDIIGIAATAASEVPFHAKAAKRVFGASHTIKLIRNADKVANFSNDVVGDISGTVSGALGAAIILQILSLYPNTIEAAYLSTLMTALVAALTVSGKALGKSYAIKQANSIIFRVGKLWAMTDKPMAFFGIQDEGKKGKNA